MCVEIIKKSTKRKKKNFNWKKINRADKKNIKIQKYKNLVSTKIANEWIK